MYNLKKSYLLGLTLTNKLNCKNEIILNYNKNRELVIEEEIINISEELGKAFNEHLLKQEKELIESKLKFENRIKNIIIMFFNSLKNYLLNPDNQLFQSEEITIIIDNNQQKTFFKILKDLINIKPHLPNDKIKEKLIEKLLLMFEDNNYEENYSNICNILNIYNKYENNREKNLYKIEFCHMLIYKNNFKISYEVLNVIETMEPIWDFNKIYISINSIYYLDNIIKKFLLFKEILKKHKDLFLNEIFVAHINKNTYKELKTYFIEKMEKAFYTSNMIDLNIMIKNFSNLIKNPYIKSLIKDDNVLNIIYNLKLGERDLNHEVSKIIKKKYEHKEIHEYDYKEVIDFLEIEYSNIKRKSWPKRREHL